MGISRQSKGGRMYNDPMRDCKLPGCSSNLSSYVFPHLPCPFPAPGCTHEIIPINQSQTYRFRVVSSTELVYMTVCFEGHNVTVVALDGFPVQPFVPPVPGCVDVNAAQRSALCGSGFRIWNILSDRFLECPLSFILYP